MKRLRQILLFALICVLPLTAADAAVLFSEGIRAYAAEDYERAIHLFEQATNLQPSVSRYHHWLGKAYGRRAEQVNFVRATGLAKKVRASFERAVELDNTNIQALSDLLEFYLEAPGILGGGEDKARAVAALLAKLNPAEGHRAQAAILAKKKDYAGAEREYRAALKLEPHKLGRLVDLASFLSERGRHSESDELFDRAARIDGDSPQLLFARGKQLALSKRDPHKAKELLEQYLRAERAPDDPPPSEVQNLLKKL